MATVTLTIEDNGDSIDIKLETEPPLIDDAVVTFAQYVGVKCLGYIHGLASGDDEQ
jgi:hypothetical protein